ncbi:11-beta-hydroxysteroid dehydrogenase 1A-like [Diospyros lotus]|uniref:11-beta-hydroxysteroid dehydrogenase 1A-like n=1 Tax=Diospyros lotus TaxID=55363 RepID=UPI002255E616|nr:11-beta-hydroxysteroid dehydrogenase 1A-like [Diospyros lotus]
MDADRLIHTLIYVMVVPLVFLCLCFILPPFFIVRSILSILSHPSSESLQGKVVLITGASSGIGEQVAYEYAKKGACLVIVARREEQLQKVAENARRLGSPDVVPVCADVSNADDCKRFVNEAINHFGRLDHLVNNAGIGSLCLVENVPEVTKFVPVMDTNFWGNVYPTYFAIPHLKKTKGKIVVNSSVTAHLHPPKLSFYAASKSALISFYETLRVELAPIIKVTIVTPGFVDTEMTQGKLLSRDGNMTVDGRLIREFLSQRFPMMGSSACANAIVEAVCRGDKYVTEPKWYKPFFIVKVLCPELFEWFYTLMYLKSMRSSSNGPSDTTPIQSSQAKDD